MRLPETNGGFEPKFETKKKPPMATRRLAAKMDHKHLFLVEHLGV
jgi:hypothetical protein